MKIKIGSKVAAVKPREPKFKEGKYQAILREIEYIQNYNTDYGQADVIRITYGIQEGIVESKISEMLFLGNNDRLRKFIADTKGYAVLDSDVELDFDELINKECEIEVEHTKPDSKGNVYERIVTRKFD